MSKVTWISMYTKCSKTRILQPLFRVEKKTAITWHHERACNVLVPVVLCFCHHFHPFLTMIFKGVFNVICLISLFWPLCLKQEGLAAQEKVDDLMKEVKGLREENKSLSDNYNSERVSTVAWDCFSGLSFLQVHVRSTNKWT